MKRFIDEWHKGRVDAEETRLLKRERDTAVRRLPRPREEEEDGEEKLEEKHLGHNGGGACPPQPKGGVSTPRNGVVGVAPHYKA